MSSRHCAYLARSPSRSSALGERLVLTHEPRHGVREPRCLRQQLGVQTLGSFGTGDVLTHLHHHPLDGSPDPFSPKFFSARVATTHMSPVG